MSECCMTREEIAKMEENNKFLYEMGLNNAWEVAKFCVNADEARQYNYAFDGCTAKEIFENYTASEAIEKIKAYEQKKQEEDERIKVGDEVRVGEEGRNAFNAVVYLVGNRGDCIVYQCVSSNGLHYTCTSNDAIRKTGRHFDEIESVLKQMQEGE